MRTSGRATTIVTAEDHEQLRAIERLLGEAVPRAQGSPALTAATTRPDGQVPRNEAERRRRRGASIQGWRQVVEGGVRESNGELRQGSDVEPVS